MTYCPECDSLLVYRNDENNQVIFTCPDCGYVEEKSEQITNTFVVSEQIMRDEKTKIEVVEVPSIDGIPQDIREELREQYREAMSSID
ncbi:MAG: hypothetical protein INQ03_03005 [Candidatus Heimdallarchaeota archaeon]|nr:hypothetical protein [Candidatus Heimdallarchaeota archaeon]